MDSSTQTPASFFSWLANPQLAKALLVKVGLGIAGAGLAVALLGAIALAQGQTVVETVAGVVHRLGQLLMFVGLCVVLVAQRTDLAYRTLQKTRAWLASQERHTVEAAGLTLFLISIPLLSVLPEILAGSVLLIWTVLLPAALAVVVAFEQGRRRAFCLGGMFPAMMLLIAVSVALAQSLERQPYGLGESLERLAQRHLPMFLLCWALIPATGLLALVVSRGGARPQAQGEGRTK
jgi:hypothetical protein